MALTDWTQQQDSSAQGASTSQAQSGSRSYEMDGSNGTPIITLDQSETDAPTEGKIITQLYYDAQSRLSAGVFRFQDTLNYYRVDLDSDNGEIQLVSQDSSTGTTIHDTASITTPSASSWNKIEFIGWEDGGTFNARVTSNGSQLGTDLSDSNNKFSGGAMGLLERTNVSYWDETEIFY